MYLPLQNWTEEMWNTYLKKYDSDFHAKIKQILTLSSKEAIKSHQDELWEMGVVNGTGPKYIPFFVRVFITWLLPFIDYFWHDIRVSLAISNSDLLDADRGLKKYGFISIQKVSEIRENTGNLILIAYDFIISAPFKAFVVYIFYGLVRLGSRFSTNF